MIKYARPIRGKAPKYTAKKRDFANKIFSAMEDAGIITQKCSPYGAKTRFLPMKKGSEELKVRYKFIPINNYTTKSFYPMHRLKKVLDIIIKLGYNVYFIADASNGYWVVPMKESNCNKTRLVIPKNLWVYLHMKQRLKGASHTYTQFSDLIFGPLPATKDKCIPWQDTIIRGKENFAFSIYMDDHVGWAISFNAMFEFLLN